MGRVTGASGIVMKPDGSTLAPVGIGGAVRGAGVLARVLAVSIVGRFPSRAGAASHAPIVASARQISAGYAHLDAVGGLSWASSLHTASIFMTARVAWGARVPSARRASLRVGRVLGSPMGSGSRHVRPLPALAACVALAVAAAAAAAQSPAYPTIEIASPLPPAPRMPPPDDRPQSQEAWYARDEGVSLSEARRRMGLQRDYGQKAGDLEQRLLVAERGNYAGLWIEHRPAWRVVVAFKRAPDATLRRHTADPVFVARRLRSSRVELDAARARGDRQIGALGWSAWSSTDVQDNIVKFGLGVEPELFDAAVRAGKLDTSGPVRFDVPRRFAQPAVAPEAARFVRLFPQRPGRTLTEIQPLIQATLVLRDGCLLLDGEGQDAFGHFAPEVGLALDAAGMPTFVNRRDGKPIARVGEQLAMTGVTGQPVTDPAITGPINRACGPGPVVSIGSFEPMAGFRVRAHMIDERATRDRVGREEAFRRLNAEWAAEDRKYETRRAAANRR